MAQTALTKRANTAPSPAASDGALVRAARKGNRDAIASIYNRYWRVVRAIVLSRARPQDVEDLVQDVFAVAVGRLATLRNENSLGGWLVSIARNRTADFWRRSRDTSELPDDLGKSDPPTAEANQMLARIRELPETYRETMIMRFACGLTGPEIAELTGMTHGSVRVNLHRGMALLREAIGVEDV